MQDEASSRRIERRLTTLFPSEMLEDHAEDVGVVERDRDLQMPPLVWSLVLGFTAGESRSLADFRRSYNATADNPLCPSGFYQRLTPTLAEYLRDLVERGLDEVAVPDTVSDEFDRFRDIMSADGTVLRLHEFLADATKAARRSRLEHGSTCSTTSPSNPSTTTRSPTRKPTTAPCLTPARGSKIGWYCSIRPTSSTAGLR